MSFTFHTSRRVRALAATAVGLAVSTVAVSSSAAPGPQVGITRPLRILVTNDDGVGADGIDAVVEALRVLPNVEVTVVAPATNQSGTGDAFTTDPMTVTPATTKSGYPATALGGHPADTVMFAVQHLLGSPPDLVVSGINFGQNIADAVTLSGTVGAARAASRLGIPALAVSAGIASPMDYATPAGYAAAIVQFLRPGSLSAPAHGHAVIFNLNTPSCGGNGTVRGIVLAPVGHIDTVTGYTDLGGGSVQAVVDHRNFLATDCTSTSTAANDDLEAFNNGYAPLTILQPDLG